MTNSINLRIAILFMAALMLMGMAGLPFVLFEATKPSPHLVTGLRLTLTGVLALAMGIVTSWKIPLKNKITETDIKEWLIFVGLAVIGVNGSLTYALYYLDDRMAMAVMFAAIGAVFIFHHSANFFAWVAVILAIAGTFLLAINAPDQEQINLIGILFAAIGGAAQGVMFFKKRLMPENIDPGIALGSAFLVCGVSTIVIAGMTAPLTLSLIESPMLLIAMFASAVLTVIGWLILVYGGKYMSGSQKAGAASFEPVGAAFTEFVKIGVPVTGEVVSVALLVASAFMAVFVDKERQTDNSNRLACKPGADSTPTMLN